MNKTKLVNLGAVRDLLGEWEKVRQELLKGETKGFQLSLTDGDGGDRIYIGGIYNEDPRLALRAGLKMSAARVMVEDTLPKKLKRM